MFFLLLAGLAGCSVVLNKIINPGEILSFVEEMTDEDQQVVISLSNLKKDGALRYRISTSEQQQADTDSYVSEDEEDLFGDRLTNVTKNYYAPGAYRIQVVNASKHIAEFQISSYIYKKINDTNKDVVELRNLLYSLQTAMDTLGNENYYLRTHHANNLKEAKFIRRSINWLIAFPIVTMLIVYSQDAPNRSK